MDKRIVSAALGVLMMFSAAGLDAGDSSLVNLAETLFAVPSPTGYEHPMVEVIKGILPAGTRTRSDNMGSLYASWGSQAPTIAVCAPMDEAGYFVSGIRPDGYLSLDKAVSGPRMLDSFLLGHAMIVWTESGPVEGVLALPSLHILSSEMRRALEARPGLEWALLDVGAESEAGVREKGIRMLDAVTPWREIARLADNKLAGHSLGLKFCAALVLNLAINLGPSHSLNLACVWMAQTKFPLRRSRPRSALGSLRAAKELGDAGIIVVDVFPCDWEGGGKIVPGRGPVLVYTGDKGAKIGEAIQKLSRSRGLSLQIVPEYSSSVMNPFLPTREEVVGLMLPVKFSGTPAEIVDTGDADAIESLLSGLFEQGRIG